MIIRLVTLLILSLQGYMIWAQEATNSVATEKAFQNDRNPVEIEQIPSPLIAKDNARPRAILSSLGLDPDRALLPVTVVSINKYLINPLVDGFAYHLAPGTYELVVKPDSGTLLSQAAKNTKFEAKTYRLDITQNATYLIGARIIDRAEAVWNLQLFQLQQQVVIPTPE